MYNLVNLQIRVEDFYLHTLTLNYCDGDYTLRMCKRAKLVTNTNHRFESYKKFRTFLKIFIFKINRALEFFDHTTMNKMHHIMCILFGI
jgi:hypothetical protein